MVFDSVEKNFGILIAYGLPGFLFLLGVPPDLMSIVERSSLSANPPTLGGFLYALPVSLGLGLVLSGVRWAVVDLLMHRTGLRQPRVNYAKLTAHLPAFTLLVEHNYRYYQFYPNTLVAVILLLIWEVRLKGLPSCEALVWLAVLCCVLFAAARDCLARYYARLAQVLPTAVARMDLE